METSRLDLSARGTLFTVRDFAGEKVSSAALSSGNLEVSNGWETVDLDSLQSASTDLSSKRIRLEKTTTFMTELPWQEAYFDFSQENLTTSLRRVAAWYGRSGIAIEKGIDTLEPGGLRGGLIRKDISLHDLLRKVETSKMRFDTTDNKIVAIAK